MRVCGGDACRPGSGGLGGARWRALAGALARGLTRGLACVAVLDELLACDAFELLGIRLLVADFERGVLHRCSRRRRRLIGGNGAAATDDGDGGEYGDG